MKTLKNKEIKKIISKQKITILKIYEIEFQSSNGYSFVRFIFSRLELLSSVVLCLGLTVFIIVSVRENPIIEHVDAGALFQDTASRVSQNLSTSSEQIKGNIGVIEDSIKKIEYAIAYAKKNNLKEYYSSSKVDYISTLETLRVKLYNLRSQKIAELEKSFAKEPISLFPSQTHLNEEQEIRVLLTSLSN